jgi:hypothetical protein
VPGDRISSRIGAPSHSPLAPSTDRRDYSLVDQYRAVRARTERLAWPLSHEDQAVQSMPDASPTKWHRAHTTWFFETFVLMPHLSGYRLFDAAFAFIFNSYYDAVGPRHPRARRGLLTRPTRRRSASTAHTWTRPWSGCSRPRPKSCAIWWS